MSRGWQRGERRCVTLALVALLPGCLRFGYDPLEQKGGLMRDAGMDAGAGQNRADAGSQMDAQLPAAGMDAGAGGRGSEGGAGLVGSGGNSGDSGSQSEVDASADAHVSDAATADAGSPSDAGSMDAAMPAADSGSADSALPFASCMQGPGVLFCNGFEEALPWVPGVWDDHDLTNGNEERATDVKHDGTASGHLSTLSNSSGTSARVICNGLGGIKSGELWLRYYYYLPSRVMIDSYFTAGVLSELASPYAGVSLLIRPGQLQVKSTLMGNKSVGFVFPRNQWVCLEHRVVVDASAGFFEIYVDGVRTLISGTGNSIPNSGWTSADVGIHEVATNQSPVDVYVDNVVISTSRYGCADAMVSSTP